MESKHIMWIIVAFVLAMAAQKIVDERTNTVAAEKGLEQCPIMEGSHDKIWVKDCAKYLDKLKELDK